MVPFAHGASVALDAVSTPSMQERTRFEISLSAIETPIERPKPSAPNAAATATPSAFAVIDELSRAASETAAA